MIRKIRIIMVFAILPLFILSCSNNTTSQDTSITMNFNGAEMMESLTGLSDIQKGAGTISVIPSDINTIEINVANETEVVYNQTFDRAVIADSSDRITLDIPSGTGLTFTVSAYNAGGILNYNGSDGPLDLIPGTEITVTITLSAVAAVQDAAFSVNLRNYDDTAAFTAPSCIAASGNVIIADIYKPISTGGILSLEVPIATQNYTSFTDTLTGLVSYPKTYQLLMVRAMTLGTTPTIAAIGAAVISGLSSGTNDPINVRMVPPGIINVTYTSGTITSIKAEMDFGTGFIEVASTGLITENTAVLLVPNGVQNIGTEVAGTPTASVPRTVKITVNGTSVNTVTLPALRWKAVDLMLPLPN